MPQHSKLSPWIVIMLAGSAMVTVTLGIRQVFGLFVIPVSTELGGGLQFFSLTIAFQNLVWGISSPFFGAIADRYGAWRVAACGALLYAAGLLLMALYVTDAGVFIGQVFIGLGLGSAGISIAVGAVARAAPPEKRSLALGLVTSFGSFGQFALVPFTQELMSNYGWQTALIVLSVIMASMVAVSLGLRADNQSGEAKPSVTDIAHLTASSALRSAASSRDYILLTIGFFVCGLHLVFITTHLPTYLADAGISLDVAGWALALIGLFNIVGAFICGWLGGVTSKKNVLATIYLLRGIAIALFILTPITSFSVLAFGAAMGLLWLGTIPLTSGLIVVFFGPKYLSMLYGVVFFSHQIGSFVGAWLGGIWYDVFGNYEAMWWLNVGFGVFAFIINLLIREPRSSAPAFSH
ncbi:MFS transporter [Candidatus Puniceispirillum sp.]|uniref:MFS transporter n=1 Tax=Candidatus Puniceispirillum sp. TaxID=2026719 RepID=UPI002FCE6211